MVEVALSGTDRKETLEQYQATAKKLSAIFEQLDQSYADHYEEWVNSPFKPSDTFIENSITAE